MTNKQIIRELDKYEAKSSHHNLPVVWDRAEGVYVWDVEKNKYLDFTCGIFVTNIGHSNTDICNSLRKQINQQLIHSYSFPTKIRLDFLKELIKFSGYEKAFLTSAGTEATEAACKTMRLATKRNTILSFEGCMHGKTNFVAHLREDLDFLDFPNLIRLQYPKDAWHWRATLREIDNYPINNIAGIIIESYRGWDAQLFSPFYIQELVEWAKKHKILVCFDEIQAGIGRTGKKFTYEWYEVKPDLVCLGKGLGGGVPISAVLGSRKLLDIPNDLSSTHSANPLVCAAALANLQYLIKHNLIKNALLLDKTIGYIDKFIEYKSVVRTNWCGLVGAIIFQTKEQADKVAYDCMKNGLLVVHTGRESIKLGPPLCITEEEVFKGLQIIENAIKKL